MEPGEKMIKGIDLFVNGLAESVVKLLKEVSASVNRFIDLIPPYKTVVLIQAKKSSDSRKRKAYVIYHRTKNKRIKKKQLKIMEG